MNKKQRILLWCVAVIQIAMSLFPPHRYMGGVSYYGVWLDVRLLDFYLYFAQWSVLVVLGFIAYHLLRD